MFSDTMKPRGRFGTIGARLTLWSAGITLAVCALLSAVLYAGLSTSLHKEIDSFLAGEVREFMVTINAHPNNERLQEAIRRELGSRSKHDLAFRLFDTQGRLLVTSEPDDPIAALWNAPDGWNRAQPHIQFQTVRPVGRPGAFRTCSLRITTDDGRTGTAQASYTLDRMDASLVLFRRVEAIGLALAAILSVVSGRMLAGRSLRPVQTVTETAERISAENLSERIPLSGADDEFDRLARTLNGMLARIEQHVQRVQQFTADASHELRSPLAALRGSAEVALTKPRTADELRQVLEESIEHYDRLSHIAEDLLLLAQADAGYEVAHREPVQLDQAVETVVDLYTPLAQDRGIVLVFEDHEAVSLEADGARLRQLVGNLIDNAIKFTKSGDRISVSLTNRNGIARITVADTGQGIGAAHVPHVFDRFYRADPARSAKHGGAGLGLPICRAIAQAHHGEIDVQSVPGKGTMVTVTVPLNGGTTKESG